MAGNIFEMGSYSPDFGVGKNFKTLTKDVGSSGSFSSVDPDYIRRLAKARPDLFAGIDDPASLLSANMVDGESTQQQQGWNLDPQLQAVFDGMSLQRRGADGKKDGRTNALYDKQGNLVYADTPYSYDPAGDTWKAVGEAAALSAAVFGGLGLAGAGPLGGALGGVGAGGAGAGAAELGANGAFLGEAAWAPTAGGSLFEGAAAAGAAGAEGAAAVATGAGEVSVKAALFGETAYGAGMSGAATTAFDTVLATTGSLDLAAAAGKVVNGASWLSSSVETLMGSNSTIGKLLGGSSTIKDILGLVGAGVSQYSADRQREKDREAVDRRDAAKRRRQAPVQSNIFGAARVINGGTNAANR